MLLILLKFVLKECLRSYLFVLFFVNNYLYMLLCYISWESIVL
uniref:Uncharacterized protein n=1 Tax=Arundo donax TaxID=35708 RepID=A0A0A9A1X7_ARUDO